MLTVTWAYCRCIFGHVTVDRILEIGHDAEIEVLTIKPSNADSVCSSDIGCSSPSHGKVTIDLFNQGHSL